jgi:eukaryotic-like serine/threonine-protein kinase
MTAAVKWYQTLAWKFFLRTAIAVLALMGAVLWLAYDQAGKSAQQTAGGTLASASQVLEKTFEERAKVMDAGLEVFVQYSGNLANIEKAQDLDAASVSLERLQAAASLKDTLVDNLPRLGAQIAMVIRPDGTLLASTADDPLRDIADAGVVQMALAPEEAKAAGNPGPFYRGFLRNQTSVYHAVARPLLSPGGTHLGAMLVGTRIDDEAAESLLRLAIPRRKLDPPSHLAFLSHFKVLGATTPEKHLLDQLLARNPGFVASRAQVLDGARSKALRLMLEGQNYFAVISPMKGVNALDLEMASVLLLPRDPLLAPFQTLQRAILGAGLAGIFVALLLALRSANSVTAPLKMLMTTVAALAEGERPRELPPIGTQDEVGALTKAFRTLLADLRAKEDLLAWLEKAQPAPHTDRIPTASPATATKIATAQTPVLPKEGEVFASRYRVEGILGYGGMGVVLKVRDLQLDEDVALKVIRPELAQDEAFLQQLKQEIRLARRITHRNVLRTHDFGECDGMPYVTMEFLKGVTLHQLMADRGRLPFALSLRIARQLAEGLEAAHAVGVVHRDIKPLNVLFDIRGDAKLMDFGLAAPVAARGWGEDGMIFGTPRYMSPEQVRGERVDPRADLYSFGVLLFELCAGEPPYDSSQCAELLLMHVEAPIPRLQDIVPPLPLELSIFVERLMAKSKEDRPQTATEVVEILKLLASEDLQTRKLG